MHLVSVSRDISSNDHGSVILDVGEVRLHATVRSSGS